MQLLRKFLLVAASSIFSWLLVLLVIAVSLNHIFGTPAVIKRSLAESGLYQKLVDDIVDQSRAAAGQPQEGMALPLEREEIKHAARQAFSPDLLRSNMETAIDGTYAWLEGRTDKPEFQVDLTAGKKDFAIRVGSYLRQRVADLPPCSLAEIPNPYDPFTATCRPPGVNLEPEVQRLTAQLQTTPDYLPDTVISADELNIGQAGYLRDWFRLMRQSPFIIGLLTVMAAAVIIALRRPWPYGLRLVGRASIFAGVFSLLSYWLFGVGLALIGRQVANRPIHSTEFVQNTIINSLLESMQRSVQGLFITFCLLYIIGGLLLVIAARSILKRRIQPQELANAGQADTTDRPPADSLGPSEK